MTINVLRMHKTPRQHKVQQLYLILYDVKLNNENNFDLKPHMEDDLLDLKNTPDMGFVVVGAVVAEKCVVEKGHKS